MYLSKLKENVLYCLQMCICSKEILHYFAFDYYHEFWSGNMFYILQNKPEDIVNWVLGLQFENVIPSRFFSILNMKRNLNIYHTLEFTTHVYISISFHILAPIWDQKAQDTESEKSRITIINEFEFPIIV